MAAGDSAFISTKRQSRSDQNELRRALGRRLLEAWIDHNEMALGWRQIKLREQVLVVQGGPPKLYHGRRERTNHIFYDRVLPGGDEVRSQIPAKRLATEHQQTLFAQPSQHLLRIGSHPGIACQKLVIIFNSGVRALRLNTRIWNKAHCTPLAVAAWTNVFLSPPRRQDPPRSPRFLLFLPQRHEDHEGHEGHEGHRILLF